MDRFGSKKIILIFIIWEKEYYIGIIVIGK